jgi:hypothetical protein
MIHRKFDPRHMPSIKRRLSKLALELTRLALLVPDPPPRLPAPPRLCTVEGCGRKYRANGHCTMHEQRNARNGNPLIVKVGGHPKSHKVCFCGEKAIAFHLCKEHYNVVSYVNRKMEKLSCQTPGSNASKQA